MFFLLIKRHQASQLITINTRNYGNADKPCSLTVIAFNTHIVTYKMLSLMLLKGTLEREVNVSSLKVQNKKMRDGVSAQELQAH